jgi:hypothetical protein
VEYEMKTPADGGVASVARVAVPDKIIGLTLILDFIDRCPQNTSLALPPAALGVLAQTRLPTNWATPGNVIYYTPPSGKMQPVIFGRIRYSCGESGGEKRRLLILPRYVTLKSSIIRMLTAMALSAKSVRSQISKMMPLLKNCSLETIRKGQNTIGALMEAKHRRQVMVKEHPFAQFSGAWIIPEDERRQGVILYIHGGGFTCGDLEYAKGFGSTLAYQCGVRVFCAGYRLAPENPFLRRWRMCWKLINICSPRAILRSIFPSAEKVPVADCAILCA